MQRKIKRDYHQLSKAAAKFLAFCIAVKISLSDTTKFPDELWGSHLYVRQQFFENADILEASTHAASGGDRGLIRERDKLIQVILGLLDQMASLLEGMLANDPDKLFSTGFSITVERRSMPRNKHSVELTASRDFTVENRVQQGIAIGSCSKMPGAFNCEIHVNMKDPSVEADWWHKGIYADTTNMVMEDLPAGNAFFRQRHHGPNGAGPWSAIVTTLIT